MIRLYLIFLFLFATITSFAQDSQIEDIKIEGTKRTKVRFLKELVQVRPGDVLDSVILKEAKRIEESYSISAGLDYPGVGPLHAFLYESKRAKFMNATDKEALAAAYELTKIEGIIPALESAHALAVLPKLTFKKDEVVVINLSGRGDKDLETYIKEMESSKVVK